jgi:tRNA A-37 threonylcarbamoyl transferase component Bud32
MRDIQELIEHVEKYKNVSLQRRFESKKNTVAYVVYNGQPRIFKWYVPGLKQNMDLEYSILKKGFSDLTIPSPLAKDSENNVLVMSYIMGENVCDIVNDTRTVLEEKKKVVHLLADWFVNFHSFFKSEDGFRLRGDANLKNFVLSRGRIWGVDFEESRIGRPSEDLATLCVSLLSTNPMFTDEKFQLCQIFLDSYRKSVKWDVEQLNADISYALLERIQWRPNDEEILRKYATRIRNKGLRVARHNF